MKKFIVVIASLLLAVSAHAQIGVVAGITSSKSTIDAAIADVQNITQYHVGLTYKFDLGRIFAIQPSLIYNVKGAKIQDVRQYYQASGDISLFDFKNGYLELPVQIQAGLNLGVARIYAIAEPFIGYAITNSTQSSAGTKIDVQWDKVKNKLEYGVGLGAGIELIKHVQVSARYYWNLGEATKATWASVTEAVSSRAASGIIASVAILF